MEITFDMIHQEALLLIAVAYTALLFGVAYAGDWKARRPLVAGKRNAMVYSLALAIYCTSWTFYGAVGRATSSGWDYLPIYLGPACVFLFGFPLLRKIIAVSKINNITSVADFVGARYGRHQITPLALTAIATIGIVPYIALQLKAVSFAFEVLVGTPTAASLGGDGTIALAAVMAVFAILFGTRELSATENHHGMVLAMAFESLVKLLAFLAVGTLALSVIVSSGGTIASSFLEFHASAATGSVANFATQTLLAAIAIVCLPRQFHIAVVEHSAPSDLRTARFVFPAYLLLISIFVIPIVQAGRQIFGHGGTQPDTFVLSLPLALNHQWLGLVAYVGGFSAATGMVIVETIAISTMISNEIVIPVLLRSGRFSTLDGTKSVPRILKLVRRAAVVVVIALSYGYYRLFAGQGTLAQIGLLSFAAVAQFAPSLIGGVLWKNGTYMGATVGLIGGFVAWVYTLLVPALASPESGLATMIREGPLAIQWLKPQALFGMTFDDPLTHGVLWSLGINMLLYVGVPLVRKPGLRELIQASTFLSTDRPTATDVPDASSSATVGDVRELAQHFLGARRAEELFSNHRRADGSVLLQEDQLSSSLARAVEHALAGFIGASSARLVMHTTLKGKNMRPEQVIRLLDETSHAILFTREFMRTALEHLPQAICVVDGDLRLVAWNHRYISMFEYPAELVQVGTPVQELIRFNADRGWLITSNVEKSVDARLRHMRSGTAYTHQREMPNGVVLEMRGNPMPGGGFVTSYSDVTTHKQFQAALQDSNASLERRVNERTAELVALNTRLAQSQIQLEHAHASKTRFLAAASHDLAQPITAARLFIASLAKSIGSEQTKDRSLLRRAEGALGSAEETLTSLLDFNRLDGGAERFKVEHVHLPSVISSLLDEFSTLAEEKKLLLKSVNCNHVVISDAHLLRRVLQNFLSNAIRYTDEGAILIGCRRRQSTVSIHVLDTGRGIPQELHREIFQEYRQLVHGDKVVRQGLGLGLAIAKRIADLLGHQIRLQSIYGRGSNFSILLPVGDQAQVVEIKDVADDIGPLTGKLVCCVEDEPEVLSALRELLAAWGCETRGYDTASAAITSEFAESRAPDLLIVDYNLDHGCKGTDVAVKIRKRWGCEVPVIVLTAADPGVDNFGLEVDSMRVVRKPVRPGSLRAVIDFILN